MAVGCIAAAWRLAVAQSQRFKVCFVARALLSGVLLVVAQPTTIVTKRAILA
jgi:hypothetical protein